MSKTKQSINNKSIKVHCTDIKIELTTPDFGDDNLTDCYGHYLKRKNLIQIQSGLSDIDEANTISIYLLTLLDTSLMQVS